MKEIFTCFFTSFFIFITILPVSAIDIVERSQWGADEEFRYVNTPYWETILKNREEKRLIPATESEKALYAKQKRIDRYLVDNFGDDLEIVSSQYKQGENRLAWPVKKTNYVKAIIVHHTHTEYSDSLSGVNNIYKYHTLSREWGDIGYNFLIGYDGKVYEGRAGGDYTVAAHTKNNNFSTVGIALLGNYDLNEPTNDQYEALSLLIRDLSIKYGIDLSKKFSFHKSCISADDCDGDIETTYHYPVIGHLDAGHTSCPGEHLHEVLEDIRLENLIFTKGLTPVSYLESLEPADEKNKQILTILRDIESKRLIGILAYINRKLRGEIDISYVSKLKTIRGLVLQVLRERG